MPLLCQRCAKIATHRLKYEPWREEIEVILARADRKSSATGSARYCLYHAWEVADLARAQLAERQAHVATLDSLRREVYVTVEPVTKDNQKRILDALKMSRANILPWGHVSAWIRRHHVYIELWPPADPAKPWDPHEALYRLRYYVGLPLVFRGPLKEYGARGIVAP